MIYFDLTSKTTLINQHLKKLKNDFLNDRLDASSLNKPLKKFITDNLDEIIIGNPSKLQAINTKFKKHSHYKKGILSKVKKIFDYQEFSKKKPNRYDCYDLAKMFDVRTCLYCNRMYTLTVVSGKKNSDKYTRPQFDHFIDKGENPLLALSIYNLIPSCNICNSTLKGRTKFNLNSHIHPYVNNIINSYSYNFKPYNVKSILGGNTDLEVYIDLKINDLKLKQKAEKSIRVFRLEEIMSAHSDELKDLLELKHHFSNRYFKELIDNYKHLSLSFDEMYRIVFGVYFQEVDFSKRPFSKLKKDILKILKII